MDTDPTDLTPSQKVAILMVALGEEAAGAVLGNLNQSEIEQVTAALADLSHITPEVQSAVLAEFEDQFQAGQWIERGGLDFARGALERALGPQKAQVVLDRVAGASSSGFHLLRRATPDQIVPFISSEHPQTIALILSQLDADQAAGILAQLPEAIQADVAYRVATTENVTPAVLRQIEESLAESLGQLLSGHQAVGGPKVVANMLNLTGSSLEQHVLEHMDGNDPEIAEQVRNLMFVFGDLSKLTDRDIQLVLRELDKNDLILALKQAEPEVSDKLLSNMSERVRTMIKDEIDLLGPTRLSEVEEAQMRIVQRVRQLEEQSQITLVRGDADDTFV